MLALVAALAVTPAGAGCDIPFTVQATWPDGHCLPDTAPGPADAAVDPRDAALSPFDGSFGPVDGATDASADLPDASSPPDAEAPADADAAPPDAAVDSPDGGTCADSLRNGSETDVDCGGRCAPCADCRSCQAATDCSGGTCTTGVCGAAGGIRVRATYWTINDVWLRHVNVVLDCQSAVNRQCTLPSGCSTTLAGDCGGTCDSGEQCWVDTTYGSPQGQKTIDLVAALGCPHTVCLYPGSYPGYEWGGTLEVFESGWRTLATTTDLTGWNWLCAAGVQAR